MKFNYKKVASIFASAIMLSSTIGFAAAATYPSPFTGGAAVVYGENAATTDMAAAIDIYKDLSSKTTTTSTGTTTAVSGEAKAIETSGQKLYLGDYMNTTKSTLTKADLPTVLADGKIIDDEGTSFDYNQKINTPNTYVTYGRTTDYLATPIPYVYFEGTAQNYSTDVVFPTAVNVTKLTNKDITLFGRKYTFSGSATDLTTTKLVLFENAQSQTVKSGESADVTIEGAKHTVAVTSVEDGTHGTITVDGVSQAVTEGNTYKVSGLDLYVKNIIGPSVAGETRAVELYLGSSKLTLQNGASVVKGSTTIYGTTVAITTSGTDKVSKVSISTIPLSLDTRIKYIKEGNQSLTDAVFGTFKISFGSIEPELTDSTRDEIIVKSTGESKGGITWTNKNGYVYSGDLFNYSSSIATNVNSTGMSNASVTDGTYYKYKSVNLGFDNYDVITSNTAINENDYVITTSGQYSQMWQVTRIDVANTKVNFRDMGAGAGTQSVSLSSAQNGSTGSLTLGDGSSATVVLNSNVTTLSVNLTSGTSAVLYTKNGAKIDLTGLKDSASNTTLGSKVIITEETSYNDGDYKSNTATTLGQSAINVSIIYDPSTRSGNDVYISAISVPNGGSGAVGDYDTYYLTNYGSYIKYTGNNDKVFTVSYPKQAAAMKVYVGEVASSITPGSTGTATGAVTIVKDSEIASVSDKNLVVVGGSCINTVAAKILGSDSPLCAEDFGALTKVSAGGYIIKTVTSPYNTGKVAMLVAGYNAVDTQNAAARAVQSDVKTDVGTEEVYPVTA